MPLNIKEEKKIVLCSDEICINIYILIFFIFFFMNLIAE